MQIQAAGSLQGTLRLSPKSRQDGPDHKQALGMDTTDRYADDTFEHTASIAGQAPTFQPNSTYGGSEEFEQTSSGIAHVGLSHTRTSYTGFEDSDGSDQSDRDTDEDDESPRQAQAGGRAATLREKAVSLAKDVAGGSEDEYSDDDDESSDDEEDP